METVFNCNTHLGVDVKTVLRSDRCARVGKSYLGVFRRDEVSDDRYCDEHFTFTETLAGRGSKRNPHLFEGRYITVTRRDDGSLRLNFKALREDQHRHPARYALGVYHEICIALESLVVEVK